jgi:hypothetical protein
VSDDHPFASIDDLVLTHIASDALRGHHSGQDDHSANSRPSSTVLPLHPRQVCVLDKRGLEQRNMPGHVRPLTEPGTGTQAICRPTPPFGRAATRRREEGTGEARARGGPENRTRGGSAPPRCIFAWSKRRVFGQVPLLSLSAGFAAGAAYSSVAPSQATQRVPPVGALRRRTGTSRLQC